MVYAESTRTVTSVEEDKMTKKTKKTKKTNVVIIMADQLRADVLGGQYTPNINKLAEEGVVFRRSYCACPLCVPARGSFFTGRYPNETGSFINPWEKTDEKHGYVRAGIPNLYSLMEEEWDSWHIGKQHLFTEEKIDSSPVTKTHWGYTTKRKKVLNFYEIHIG